MRKSIAFVSLLATLSVSAQVSIPDRFDEPSYGGYDRSTYLNVLEAYAKNDSRADLDCVYVKPRNEKVAIAISKSKLQDQVFSRKFKLINSNKTEKEAELKVFTKEAVARNGDVIHLVNYSLKIASEDILINGNIIEDAVPGYNKRMFNMKTDKMVSGSIESFNDLELNQLRCKLNFVQDEKVSINDSNNKLHINVHPHKRYDWNGKIGRKVMKRFEDTSVSNLVLLEDKNWKGNSVNPVPFLLNDELKFYSGEKIHNAFSSGKMTYGNKIEISIPDYVDYNVAPSGVNRYLVDIQDDATITITGGNHNYCMANTVHFMMKAYLNSESTGDLKLVYPVNEIMVQARGEEKILKIKKGILKKADGSKTSGRLGKVLPFISDKYHENYLGYMKASIRESVGMFKTLKIHYTKETGVKAVHTLHGTGERKLNIHFTFVK